MSIVLMASMIRLMANFGKAGAEVMSGDHRGHGGAAGAQHDYVSLQIPLNLVRHRLSLGETKTLAFLCPLCGYQMHTSRR